jgi:hypothetical protein
MDIKPVPGVPSFQVNTVNESSDEERRQNLARRDFKKRKSTAPGKTPALLKTEPHEESKNEDSISRQIIDSEKVIELLSSRPAPTSSAGKYSVKLPSTKTDESSVSDLKKFNKRL